MNFLFLLIIFLLLLFLLIFFMSIKILVNSTKYDSMNAHFLEIGLIFNTLRLQVIYQDKQKFIKFKLGNWKIFSRDFAPKEKIKAKEKKIKPRYPKSFREKLTSFLWPKSWRLGEIKNHVIALIRCFKNPKIEGQIQIGFSNPMDTGLLMGGYSFLTGILTNFQKNVIFVPVFTNSAANWQLSFSSKVILARCAWRGLLIWNTIRKIK